MANRVVRVLTLVGLVCASARVAAAPGVDDYRRSLGLRDVWSGLTRDVAFPAQWRGDGHFYYRHTVEGGFAFVLGTPDSPQLQPAFDAVRLAQGLSTASGQVVTPLKLPFSQFSYVADGSNPNGAIRFTLDSTYAAWRCTLTDYVCAPVTRASRPRGFGVVRDLRMPADNAPRRSPDGQWEAYAEGFNVVLRHVADGKVTPLTRDGRGDGFYDPETIAWSPDSRHVALYRVTPGFPRLVTRVESAPAGQVQPVLQTQLYPKPGDAVDIEQPVLFDLAGNRRTIDTPLLSNPYSLSPIQWRTDSSSFSLEYVARGFQKVRVVGVEADTGKAHAAIEEKADTFVYADRTFLHDVGGQGAALDLRTRRLATPVPHRWR